MKCFFVALGGILSVCCVVFLPYKLYAPKNTPTSFPLRNGETTNKNF